MKFKKIEISAFRIYNNPENACFDFTTKTGDTADFISLYAPNGFGKTSFYDAVEWGITGSVNRFFIRPNNELYILEGNQSSKNEIPLLRNSKLERDTYVKVYTNSHAVPFEKEISRESIGPDLPLKKNTFSHEFQKVILSQDWISAFLTEKNGEERYKKFMENPELSGINDYYINLKHLLSAQQTEENKLKDGIGVLKSIVKDIEDENLLETINHQINSLISDYSQNVLKEISIETTDKELIDFKGLISTKIIYYNNKKDSLEKLINQLRVAKVGNDDLLGVKSYSKVISLFPKLLQELVDVKGVIKKFEEHDELVIQLIKKQEMLKRLSVEREELEPIVLKFDQYSFVKNNIKNKTISQIELEKASQALIESIENLKREEISAQEKLKSCLLQIEANEDKTKLLPTLQNSLSEIDKSIATEEKLFIEYSELRKSSETKITKLKTQNTYFKTRIDEIGVARYSIKDFEEEPKFKKIVSELEIKNNKIAEKRKELITLNSKIEKQQVLNSSIQEFIKEGLKLVNESQSSNCPLCEQSYSDFSMLASKISGNKALSQVLQELLKQKQILSSIINSLDTEVKVDVDLLLDFYNKKIDGLNIEIEKESIEPIDRKIIEVTEKVKSLKFNKNEIVLLMGGMSFLDYRDQLKEQKSKFLNSKIKSTRELNVFKDQLKIKIEKNEEIKKQLILLIEEKEDLLKNEDYLTILNYFKKNYPSENISKLLLINSLESLENNQSTCKEDAKLLSSLISPLNIKLSKYSLDKLNSKVVELEKQRTSLEKRIDNYILFLKENFEINADVYNSIEIESFIENENSKSKQELDISKLIYDGYVGLDKKSEHIVDFLQTENTKIKIKEKEKELDFLESTVRMEIEREREAVKKYLKERIKDFFFEGLINKLYEKIDPHPEFKEVNFIPNFDSDTPRLDVFVKSESSETLIPNLYFSTAQINILSLCIFLASALKSKDYDCIFIDDPIQSMDSINVLSTIDLLRSLVVNNGKQIIISTHDENFHKLLKKKMPTDIFQSKFLKLESFGKVSSDMS
jgi:exonuclease SbcC